MYAENNITTVVTAFFDLGSFQKGRGADYLTPEHYFKWSRVFRLMRNPLVVYTDSVKFQQHMLNIRANFTNYTSVELIGRESSWAFSLRNETAKIFSQKDYPKHPPNTVYPDYSCTQHAKYDVITRAVRNNYFRTTFFMWLDIGYFRKIYNSDEYFYLGKPRNFNETKVAVTLIQQQSMHRTPSQIFRWNSVWVGGGLFYGRSDILLQYAKQYKRAVNYFLSQKLANTDQQVLFAMYSNTGQNILYPEVQLQFYFNKSKEDWYYLGYIIRKIIT